MAGLQAPLSTLRPAPRGALRMTRGQSGLLFLLCLRLSLFTLCRSPGALAGNYIQADETPVAVQMHEPIGRSLDHGPLVGYFTFASLDDVLGYRLTTSANGF